MASALHNRAPPLLTMMRGRAVLLFCAIATVAADVNTPLETTVSVRVATAESQGVWVSDQENTTLDFTAASEGSRPVGGAGVKNGVAPTSKFAGSPENDAQALVQSARGATTENCIPSSGATVACGGVAGGVRVDDAVKSGSALAVTGDRSDTPATSDPRRLLARRMMPRHGRALAATGTCAGC